MNKSTLSVSKALCAFIFAGLIPAFTSVARAQAQITITTSSNSPEGGAFKAGTGGNKILTFDIQNSGNADDTIDLSLNATGPVTSLVMESTNGTVYHPDNVYPLNSNSGIGFGFYPFVVPANSFQELTVIVRISTDGAGQSANVALVGIGYGADTTVNVPIWPQGNPQAVVTKLAQKNSLLNISARGMVTAQSPLIGGFVISSDNADKMKVLVRAVGPTLSAFGVANVLGHPYLTIYNASGLIVAQNEGWSTGADVTAVENAEVATGTFGFSPGSLDAALVLSLAPGAYTAEVTSSDGTVGTALVEIYEVPDGPLPTDSAKG